DDGTITPTAVGGSFAFTPHESLAALRYMYATYRTRLWGPYGFRDAFNPTQKWFATDYLAIDQGPIVLMIENYWTGRIWHVFMQHMAIQRGLARAGFAPVTPSEKGKSIPDLEPRAPAARCWSPSSPMRPPSRHLSAVAVSSYAVWQKSVLNFYIPNGIIGEVVGRYRPPRLMYRSGVVGSSLNPGGSKQMSSSPKISALTLDESGLEGSSGTSRPEAPDTMREAARSAAGVRTDWFPASIWRFSVAGYQTLNKKLMQLIQDEAARDPPG